MPEVEQLNDFLYRVFSWLYRIRPSAVHKPFKAFDVDFFTNNWDEYPPNPNQVSCEVGLNRVNHNEIKIKQ